MRVTATFDKINCNVAFGSTLCSRSAGTCIYLACQEAGAVPMKALVAPWFLLTIRGDEVLWPFRDGSNSLASTVAEMLSPGGPSPLERDFGNLLKGPAS